MEQSTVDRLDTEVNHLKESLGEEWYELLHEEFSKPYMTKLKVFLSKRRGQVTVYPPNEDVFNAYKMTPYSSVRICIIGQDPYIKEGEAHGLAFSTKYDTRTPSLKQIEYAVKAQCYRDDLDYVWINNLERWTWQGVMLLNSILTVDRGISGSHRGQGWERFVAKTIELLDDKKVIFMLWGRNAQAFKSFIKKSPILECEHPQAANYRATLWDSQHCFFRANSLVDGHKIMW